MPDRNRAEGRAVFTKPAVVAGSLVEGLVVEFKAGKAVSVKADKGQAVMEKYLDTDEGARHLGEVALVSNSSPVSQSGVLFMNTLLDENAACHIAFGRAYVAYVAYRLPVYVGLYPLPPVAFVLYQPSHDQRLTRPAGDLDGLRRPFLRVNAPEVQQVVARGGVDGELGHVDAIVHRSRVR